jgi:phosphoglucomutase
MSTHPHAGKPASASQLIDVPALIAAYHSRSPQLEDPAQRVAFGTSGHRGSSIMGAFNHAHVQAITQALCEYRQSSGIRGPLYIGIDTHALSRPALESALEVLVANGVDAFVQSGEGCTPTPVISHAILAYNRGRVSTTQLADGIVITPSHNPPQDGGFKYNPPSGGPAGVEITSVIEKRANELLMKKNAEAKAIPIARALRSPLVHAHDFVRPYVDDLENSVDLKSVRDAGLRLGVDPMGGAGLGYWAPIAERYGLDLTVVNTASDPTFGFMCVDRDGKIRMDCSSSFAMAGLIGLKDKFDIAFGNDPDADRHGIVAPSVGLMNPNHYLAVAIQHLFSHRPKWEHRAAIGKTLVSSSMIDRVAARLKRKLIEVPVGFKWFVDGLLSGDIGFGGEESAGASFLRRDGSAWTTDKDGILLCLLSAEITAKTKKDPGELYRELVAEFGDPVYERIDAPASAAQRSALKHLTPGHVRARTLAGEPILEILTKAPGNHADIGGLKVTTQNGWFAARPSGTEDVYKIYAESFQGREHLSRIQAEAQQLVDDAMAKPG